MLPEFIKELDELYMELEGNHSVFSPRCEKVVVDVYRAMGGIGNGGLDSFWDSNVPQKRMIKSFQILGENQLAHLLRESKWLKKYAKSGNALSEEEQAKLCSMNKEFWDGLHEVPTKLLDYAKKNNLL